jgi:hypothetical protein
MIDVSTGTKSARHHDENGGMSPVIGVVLILVSISLIVLGISGHPQGQLVPVPNGNGSFDYVPSGGYSHPYEFLVPIGILGTIAGFVLAMVGQAMTIQRKSPDRNSAAFSADIVSPHVGLQTGLPASLSRLSVMTPSRPTKPILKPKLVIEDTHRRCLGIRASELMVHSSAGSQPIIAERGTQTITLARGRVPWMVEFVVPWPRAYRIDLEQRLSQLRSWKERGLITKQNYEEERNKILRRLHVSHMMV